MLDDLFSTFILVAQKLSFSKAAESLYLTPNAVKKRIESLERQIGVTLFIRSNKGVTLTKAGVSLYNDLINIEKDLSLAIEKAIGVEKGEVAPLHIGIMSTFSELFLTSKWFDTPMENRKPSHLIKYGASLNDLDIMLGSLGNDLDVVIDLYQPDLAKKYGLYIEKVSEFDIYLGITNIQNEEKKIDEIIKNMMIECLYPGRSDVIDTVVSDLKGINPNINFEYIDNYNLWTFQKAMEKRHSIITFENQKGHFPYLYFVKLPFKYKISFGIYYKNKSKIIDDFLHFVTDKSSL